MCDIRISLLRRKTRLAQSNKYLWETIPHNSTNSLLLTWSCFNSRSSIIAKVLNLIFWVLLVIRTVAEWIVANLTFSQYFFDSLHSKCTFFIITVIIFLFFSAIYWTSIIFALIATATTDLNWLDCSCQAFPRVWSISGKGLQHVWFVLPHVLNWV